MGKKFIEREAEQSMLFPPNIGDFVGAGHPARFVVKLLGKELSIKKIEDKYQEERGAPPYSPEMMTGILLYGYMRGEYSSRNLARACEERLDFLYITGMKHPDFRTIATFRRKHSKELEGLFVEVVRLCKEAKLIDLKHVAMDGTGIKANASADKNMSYKQIKAEEEAINKAVKSWLEKAEKIDQEEDDQYGDDDRGDILPHAEEALNRIREAKARLEQRHKEAQVQRKEAEESGEKPRAAVKQDSHPKDEAKYNFTDPESRLVRSRGVFIQGYNAQAAVDSKKQVIVSCHVSAANNDMNEMKPALKQIKFNCKKQAEEISADSGFCSEENLEALVEYKVKGYVALGSDPPERKRAIPPGSLIEPMRQRLLKGGKRSRYRLRKITVEPVFGIIKAARKFRQFLLRGIKLVQGEWFLVCASHNLWKLFNARAA